MHGIDDRDEFAVTSLDALASIYKKPADGVLRKVTDYIPEPGRAFIAASPFIVLSTATEEMASTVRLKATRQASCSLPTIARCLFPIAPATTASTA